MGSWVVLLRAAKAALTALRVASEQHHESAEQEVMRYLEILQRTVARALEPSLMESMSACVVVLLDRMRTGFFSVGEPPHSEVERRPNRTAMPCQLVPS